ncbi:MAG: efflux RND transporter periplasmic adaptor subunit [Chthoniobacteraceae bacterium]
MLKKKSVVLLLTLVVLGAGGWYGATRAARALEAKNALDERFTTMVEKRDIDFDVEVSGDVAPAFQLEVKAEVGGKIKAMHVEAGDKVKAGDVLAEIDDRDLLTEKESVLTEIEGTKLNVEKDRRNFERSQELFTAKLVSSEVFENLESAYKLSQNALARAERKLQLVEDKLRKTKVVAPMDGTILTPPVLEGQVVIAAASVNNGTTLMTLADLSKLLVNTHVNQVDVAKVRQNQRVILKSSSVRDTEMSAVISRIGLVAEVKNSIKGFQVEALIDKPDPRLRPGMSVNLVIPVAQANDAVSVPIGAVFKGTGDQRVVYVQNGGDTERREVSIGVTNMNYAQITKGLDAGETILLVEPENAAAASTPDNSESGPRKRS